MRVLVLGGYGLIGAAVVRRLLQDGHVVFGLGRATAAAARRCPKARWIEADLSDIVTSSHWSVLLGEARVEAIVNAAGALQDGARDDVTAVQTSSMRALYRAASARGISKLVQISATRADRHAETLFMRTKGLADAALMASTLDWTILRPGLVIAREAYGGTALLRALAAIPYVQPIAYADRPIHTVAVDDVAAAVSDALAGRLPSRRIYDLVEDHPHTLRQVVVRLRAWLGLAPAPLVHLPKWLIRGMARVADLLGYLGWRSPLRSTAVAELAAGIAGDPAPLSRVRGQGLASLDETLARNPATVQDRWFARIWALKPVVIGTLSLFWIVSGLVTLAHLDAAGAVLTSRGSPRVLAEAAAALGAIADIVLGVAVLWRPWMALATKGMIALTLVYLVFGTLLAPELWSDPLGPLVKAFPALVLAVVALAIAEER